MEGQTILMRGRYSAVLPVAADGNHPKLALDQGGRILVSPGILGTVAPFNSAGDVTRLIVKAAPGVLHSVYGYNSNAATRWIQFHDSAGIPALGAVPSFVAIPAAANSPFSWVYSRGFIASIGIVICTSTTRATLTAGAADMWVSGEYE